MDDQARYERAIKQVRQLKGFYAHLAIYVLVNTFLALVDLLTSPNQIWFYWPLLGWGVGLLAHAALVFGGNAFWLKDWEDRKVKEIMERAASR